MSLPRAVLSCSVTRKYPKKSARGRALCALLPQCKPRSPLTSSRPPYCGCGLRFGVLGEGAFSRRLPPLCDAETEGFCCRGGVSPPEKAPILRGGLRSMEVGSEKKGRDSRDFPVSGGREHKRGKVWYTNSMKKETQPAKAFGQAACYLIQLSKSPSSAQGVSPRSAFI